MDWLMSKAKPLKPCSVNRKSITTVLPDGIHPNLECYKALGLELARKITLA